MGTEDPSLVVYYPTNDDNETEEALRDDYARYTRYAKYKILGDHPPVVPAAGMQYVSNVQHQYHLLHFSCKS